jgi:hypothetical protein
MSVHLSDFTSRNGSDRLAEARKLPIAPSVLRVLRITLLFLSVLAICWAFPLPAGAAEPADTPVKVGLYKNPPKIFTSESGRTIRHFRGDSREQSDIRGVGG